MARRPPSQPDAKSARIFSSSSSEERHFSPTILFATEEDIPELARIHVSSLSPNLLFRLCWPNQTYHYKSVRAGLEAQFQNPEFEWSFVKAVDQDGTIMGWGAWTIRPADLDTKDSSLTSWFLFPGKKYEDEDASLAESRGGLLTENFPIIPGLPNYLHSHTQIILDDWLLGKKHLLLNALYVAPRFQRRGVGSTILKWGNERADKEGLPCFLKSTPVAWPLYKELGWKQVGQLDVDLSQWVKGERDESGWGTYKIRFGVRLPDMWKNDRSSSPMEE